MPQKTIKPNAVAAQLICACNRYINNRVGVTQTYDNYPLAMNYAGAFPVLWPIWVARLAYNRKYYFYNPVLTREKVKAVEVARDQINAHLIEAHNSCTEIDVGTLRTITNKLKVEHLEIRARYKQTQLLRTELDGSGRDHNPHLFQSGLISLIDKMEASLRGLTRYVRSQHDVRQQTPVAAVTTPIVAALQKQGQQHDGGAATSCTATK